MKQLGSRDFSTRQHFKGQVTTCAKLAAYGEKRAAGREPCWEIVPTMVDEVLDLILSAAKVKAPGEDGITVRCLGLVAGPWRSSYNPCLRCVFAKSPAQIEYHGKHSE